ncbi:T9SS type A sorting domain-containing protein [Flavobacteriaceae bacterium]|jgi:hypothetical protein|nr:T9SS type A sorting domain-containing protein [Flavobacteriaceae bacterium]|tara:strand:- start:995 stop:1477 length:483 start_codon:yes stop_codon:yes gene_type:complete
MKKLILLLTLFIFTVSIKAQIISKQVISSLGSNYSNSTIKLSSVLGEVLVGSVTDEDGSLQLGNGYYPSLNLETLSVQSLIIEVKLKVYPNPVNELLYVSHPTETKFDIYITDVTGRNIFKGKIQKQNPINISQYPKGIYLLTIMTGEIKKTNTYKIIKL